MKRHSTAISHDKDWGSLATSHTFSRNFVKRPNLAEVAHGMCHPVLAGPKGLWPPLVLVGQFCASPKIEHHGGGISPCPRALMMLAAIFASVSARHTGSFLRAQPPCFLFHVLLEFGGLIRSCNNRLSGVLLCLGLIARGEIGVGQIQQASSARSVFDADLSLGRPYGKV
jgi:hypothetical protein